MKKFPIAYVLIWRLLKLKIVFDYILYIFKHNAVLETIGLMDVNIIMTINYFVHFILLFKMLDYSLQLEWSFQDSPDRWEEIRLKSNVITSWVAVSMTTSKQSRWLARRRSQTSVERSLAASATGRAHQCQVVVW